MPSDDNPHDNETDGDGPLDGTRSVASEDAFHAALRTLVIEAAANDVDVSGGWPIPNRDAATAWDVEITPVAASWTAHVEVDGAVGAAVVAAVADCAARPADSLPPLEAAIDPTLLETVVHGDGDETASHVRFEYAGYDILLDGSGLIVLTERRPDGSTNRE